MLFSCSEQFELKISQILKKSPATSRLHFCWQKRWHLLFFYDIMHPHLPTQLIAGAVKAGTSPLLPSSSVQKRANMQHSRYCCDGDKTHAQCVFSQHTSSSSQAPALLCSQKKHYVDKGHYTTLPVRLPHSNTDKGQWYSLNPKMGDTTKWQHKASK